MEPDIEFEFRFRQSYTKNITDTNSGINILAVTYRELLEIGLYSLWSFQSDTMVTLSKSDFQLASSCPKKLVYKKNGYPTANDTNEFMEMLAKGGYIVGEMATLLFPTGIEIREH